MGRVNLNKVVMDVILLLPLTVLFQSILPVINKVVFFLVIASLLYITIRNLHYVQEAILLLAFVVVYCFSLITTDKVADNTNEYFYLLFFMLFSSYTINRYDYIKQYLLTHVLYIKRIVVLWDLCVIVSMFFKSSYRNGYFFSFTGNVFRSATAAIFILSLILILVNEKKSNIILAAVPLFCVFSGGSRTYLAVGLALAFAAYYMAAPSRRFFWMTIIPAALVVGMIILNSSIMDKINSSLTVGANEFYQDPLIKFTSGRSLFWDADLKAFFAGDTINQLFGYGFNFVYDVNEVAIHNRIWAHNDYIGILLNYGYIGLLCYVLMFKKMFTACVSQYRFPFWMKLLLIFVWAFNAFFNMFYTYSCACASYPFVLFGVSLFWDDKMKKEEIGWGKTSES